MAVSVVAVLALAFLDAVSSARHSYAHLDAVLVARCEAQCFNLLTKRQCVKTCLHKNVDKLGSCPTKDISLTHFESVCLETCKYDSQCPGVTKCCRHHCGVTCKAPRDLKLIKGLPPIPTDVRVSEGRRRRTVVIDWKTKENDKSAVLYVIEERHHTGEHFADSRLGEWTPCFRSSKTSVAIRHLVKPGRWYQFRVAAVNENGTSGFSEPSVTFIASNSPRPPRAPQNVTIGPLWAINGSLNAEVQWLPPSSDVAIQRYKIFWSRRLYGATLLDSVLVHQQTVSKEQTRFLLHNLQPNSSYFIQIQALAQFGKERLKGAKSGQLFNTTSYINITTSPYNIDAKRSTERVEGLHLQRLFWSQGDLRARVVWKNRKVTKYAISWWSSLCRENDDSNFKFAATTKASHFDLYDLQFNCRYKVSVREISSDGTKSNQDVSVTFVTPTCSQLKRKYRKIKCI